MTSRFTTKTLQKSLHVIFIGALFQLFFIHTYATSSLAEDKTMTLRVAVFPFVSFAPLYIAYEENFFSAEEINIEFIRFQRHSDSLPAMLRGDIDVDSIFTVGVMNAICRGEKIRVVAARGTLTQNNCPIGAFLAHPDKIEQLNTMPADGLKQMTFGVDRTWLDSYFLQQWLRERGLTINDVKTEYLPAYAARLEALRQGALDAAFFNEPWITTARESNVGDVWLSSENLAPGYPFSVITFGPSMHSRTDDAGVRFLRAYLRGVAQFAQGKTERNIKILSDVTKLEPDILRRICWPVIPEDGNIDPQAITRYSAWTAEQGLTDRPLSEDEIWNPDFLKEALRQ